MKLLFDDTYKNVESNGGDELFKCNCVYQFNELCKILLSQKQWDLFICTDTNRSFEVSETKIHKGTVYMDNNIWNKKE